LKDADSISYFDVNLPLYYQRHGWAETKRRCVWGYARLSEKMRKVAASLTFENEELNALLRRVIDESQGIQSS
jgi:hypothetical protein